MTLLFIYFEYLFKFCECVFYLLKISEKMDNVTENISTVSNSTNNNTDEVNSPVADDNASDLKSPSNNNWWGSWINSAKSKVILLLL